MKYIISLVALASLSLNAFANQKVINESLTFHYSPYAASAHSKEVAVVNWSSKDGIERFERTPYKGDFYRLAHHFKPQVNPAACGQAAATIALSAIYELNKRAFPVIEEWPVHFGDKTYALQYRLFNESNFFNAETDKIVDRRTISMKLRGKSGQFGGGIDIEDLQKMLKKHGVSSKLTNVKEYSDVKLKEFRELLKSVLNSDENFIIMNYDHSYKGLMGGHFSLPVAYDEKSDSVLMLDVAAHRNPWVWINLSDIYRAMATKNYSQSSYRGYLVLDTKL